MVLHEWLAFNRAFFENPPMWCTYSAGMPHETTAVSAQVLCAPYNHAPCPFMQSHIRKVYACLAVTSRLHFWQNDRDLLRVTAVTRRWNGYRNKSQHRKLALEKKILLPLLQGFEPATLQSRVRRSNHRAIYWQIPHLCQICCCLFCVFSFLCHWSTSPVGFVNRGVRELVWIMSWRLFG